MGELRIGAAIDGQFRIVRSLGRGGMGSVYLATYLDQSRVALKVVGDPPPGTSIAEFDQRFIRECRILMTLRHPAIVSAYTHGITLDGLRYLVMEYVPGRTLDSVRSRNGGPLTPAACAQLLVPVADALAYCHKRAVTHRDLSPQNVLCTDADGTAISHAKLVDFGAGWRKDARHLTTEVVFANIDFQPLERFASEARTDPLGSGIRSDVYALGALAYFLTAGEGRAGEVLSMEQKAGHHPLVPTADDGWNRFLAETLHREPERRTRDMLEMLEGFRRFVSVTTTPAVPFWEREDEVRETARPVDRVASPPSAGGSPPPDEPTDQRGAPWSVVGILLAIIAALTGGIAVLASK